MTGLSVNVRRFDRPETDDKPRVAFRRPQKLIDWFTLHLPLGPSPTELATTD